MSNEPFWDGGISTLGAALAAGHVAAAFRVVRRASWGRRLGLALGGVGLFGSAAVLITLIPDLQGAQELIGRELVLVLAIPAGKVLVYAMIVVALYRARASSATGRE